jgi:hypothetical protein
MTNNEWVSLFPEVEDLIKAEQAICDAQIKAFTHVLDACFPTVGDADD